MFLIFGGKEYYPLTGANDIVCTSDDKKEAIKQCKNLIGSKINGLHMREVYEWSHVYDTEKKEIIFSVGESD